MDADENKFDDDPLLKEKPGFDPFHLDHLNDVDDPIRAESLPVVCKWFPRADLRKSAYNLL